MAAPISKFHPRELHSTTEAVTELCSPFRESNPFLADYLNHLAPIAVDLTQSIAKESNTDLTEQGKNEDISFGDNFKSLRSIAEMKAETAALGAESESCAVIAKSIADHGGNIEEFARSVQISTMDTLLVNWATEAFQEHINRGRVRPLYQNVVDTHGALKSTEAIRSSANADSSFIPSMWSVGREISPVLSKIYSHIVDYADINKEGYSDLLASLDARLAPISTQVRARLTRNSAE